MEALFPSANASLLGRIELQEEIPRLDDVPPSSTPILMIRPGTRALISTFFFGLTSPEAEMIDVRSVAATLATVTLTDLSAGISG